MQHESDARVRWAQLVKRGCLFAGRPSMRATAYILVPLCLLYGSPTGCLSRHDVASGSIDRSSRCPACRVVSRLCEQTATYMLPTACRPPQARCRAVSLISLSMGGQSSDESTRRRDAIVQNRGRPLCPRASVKYMYLHNGWLSRRRRTRYAKGRDHESGIWTTPVTSAVIELAGYTLYRSSVKLCRSNQASFHTPVMSTLNATYIYCMYS
jgi:hypothetical protein